MTIDVKSLVNRRAINRWERISVGDLLERVTWSYPDKEALVAWEGAYASAANKRLSYKDANEKANQFANALLDMGLNKGDVVVFFCDNSVEAYLAKMGAAKAGLVGAPINTMMAPDVVEYLIRLVEPKTAVVDAELWPRAKKIFTEFGLQPAVTIPIGGSAVPGSATFEDFINRKSKNEPEVEIHGDDIWEILFTSGTTSMPRGAMLSHIYAYMVGHSFALSTTRGLHLECDLKACTFLPTIYHICDNVFPVASFLCGGTYVIGRNPSIPAMAEAITREKVTALWIGSPLLLEGLTNFFFNKQDEYDASSLTSIVYGWSALNPECTKKLKTLCGDSLVLFEIFGQTESISCFRFWPDKWPDLYQRTAPEVNYVGVPNPLLAAVLMDDDGNFLKGQARTPGEMVYRSPAITAGYYKDEEATARAFRYGWFHSGDCCIYDEDGLAIMVDRYKDVIKSGGENVSSIRVESVLTLHPKIQKASVIGLPHDKWGEAVTAIVIPKKDEEVNEDEIIAHCKSKLAAYEVPKKVVVVDSFPETVGGKVLKFKLREQYQSLYQ